MKSVDCIFRAAAMTLVGMLVASATASWSPPAHNNWEIIECTPPEVDADATGMINCWKGDFTVPVEWDVLEYGEILIKEWEMIDGVPDNFTTSIHTVNFVPTVTWTNTSSLKTIPEGDEGEVATFKIHPDSYSHTNHTGTITFTLDPGLDCMEPPPQAEAEFTVVKVELVAMSIENNEASGELPPSNRLDPGAFVPLNDDDDDYSGTPDKDQVGPVEGESDLLPISLRAITPGDLGGHYKLNIPSNVRVWLNADRSGQVNGETEFDAEADSDLYVEGVSNGAGIISVNWQGNDAQLTECAATKVTVFQFLGPTSVPALGKYQYAIEGSTGVWKQPVNGTISVYAPEQENKRLIQWHRDLLRRGQTGVVLFSPSEHYTWGREVDIVHIRLAANAGEGENSISSRNPDTGHDITGINWDNHAMEPPAHDESPMIRSSDGGPNIFRAWVQVLEIRGPSRAGVDNRGVDRLKFGFVQASRYLKKRSIYPEFSRVSELEGNSLSLDRFLPNAVGLWIEDETYTLGGSQLTNRRSYYNPPQNDAIGYGSNHLVFHYEYRRGYQVSQGDRPAIAISDRYEMGGDKPSAFVIDNRNYLYLCVNTTSGNVDADGRYYVLADAADWWRFTAYGRVIDGTVYPPNQNSGGYGSIGQMWGAYANSSLVIRNNGYTALKDINELHVELDPTHLVIQEYPQLGNGENEQEEWSNE